jgi:hypothetical protein
MHHQKMNDICKENFSSIDKILQSYRDRSKREKNRIRLSYAHSLAALRELGCKYAILLLGINLKDFHHMRNGE